VTQVQTTFVETLSDPSRQVRLLEAILSLYLLVPLPTRVDPLIKERVSRSLGNELNAKCNVVAASQTASLEALSRLKRAEPKSGFLPMSPPHCKPPRSHTKGPDDGIHEGAARPRQLFKRLSWRGLCHEKNISRTAVDDYDFVARVS
jgi:hypothetical protein